MGRDVIIGIKFTMNLYYLIINKIKVNYYLILTFQ